jgi:uncharacterized protein (DUF362 family)
MGRRFVIRGLLGALALLIVGVVTFRWRMVRLLLSRPQGPAVTPVQPADAFQREGRSRVVLVAGGDAKARVYECLARIGAEQQLQVAGKKVLVKPNVVGAGPNPATTNPEVIRALCQWLKEHGAETVWVGDMSAVMSAGTAESMKASGIEQAAREAGALPVYFEEHAWIPVDLPGAQYVKNVPVTEFVRRADVIINVPVIKSHKWATYSVCLKNFVGATHGRYRPYMIDSDHWEEIVSEINLAYRPDFNLVDGTRVMYTGGPWKGDEAETGLVLAGGDRIACDAVAVALMKTFPADERLRNRRVWEQRQIRHAQQIGLGLKDPQSLELEVHWLEEPPADLRSRLDEMRRLLFL